MGASPTQAESIRLATFAAPLSRDGPGLLLRDLARDDPQIAATVAIISTVAPDVLVLTDIDHDYDHFALYALRDMLADSGAVYEHTFTAPPNAGMMTDLDLDQNGKFGEPRDAHGYGRFAGDGGMAILSRWPIGEVTDLSTMRWIDLPGAQPPEDWPANVLAIQRLSSANHWIVPILHADGPFNLMAYSATPPVFDGPEDRNGLRNRDELRLWTHILNTDTPENFVVVGNTNLDPIDGDGLTDAMVEFLARSDIQDPQPVGEGGGEAASAGHFGDPALDTVDWPEDGPGNLRVSYVLPSTDWRVTDAGVFWPAADDPVAALLGSDGLAAGAHRLVWVDVTR